MEGLLDRFHKSTAKNIIFIIFLLVYAVFLLYLCNELNVSEDESYTLNTTSKSLAGVIHQSYIFEGQPPFYFLLIAIWRTINPSVFFARFSSIVFILLAAWQFLKLVNYFAGKENSKWMVAVFLLNPYTVWTALDIRLYALLILLSVCAIYFFFRYYTAGSRKHLLLFLLTSLVGLYTQYFFGVLIAGLVLPVWFFRGWKPFFNLCLWFIPVALLFLPNLVYLSYQINMHQNADVISYAPADVLKRCVQVLHTPQNMLFSISSIPSGTFGLYANRILRLVFIVLFVRAYILLIKRSGEHDAAKNFLYWNRHLLVSVIIVVLMLTVMVAITGIIYNDIYMTVGFVLMLLLLAIFRVYRSIVPKAVVYALLCTVFVFFLYEEYKTPVNTYDFNYMGKYIGDIEKPGEPILIYRNVLSLPFQYSYKGSNPVIPVPAPVNFDTSYIQNIKDPSDLLPAFSKIPAGKTWLYINDLDAKNTTHHIIDNYLQEHCNTLLDTLYKGRTRIEALRIRRLEFK